MASSLGDEFDLPLGRVLHGFAAIEQRKVRFLLVNTEVRPSTNGHQSLEQCRCSAEAAGITAGPERATERKSAPRLEFRSP
jgi:hypothetical protein